MAKKKLEFIQAFYLEMWIRYTDYLLCETDMDWVDLFNEYVNWIYVGKPRKHYRL